MDAQLEKLLQEQVKNEWYSAYLYLSMAAWCESINLAGFGHWMRKQASEEQVHGQKIFDFLVDRGVKVVLQAIPQPPSEFASPLEVFEKSLEHEKKVTAMIHAIADAAEKANDHPTKVFIQWFVTEQVEEEKNASYYAGILKGMPPGSAGVFQVDHRLSKRE